MARVHESAQNFLALSNQVAEGADFTPLNDFLNQLVPGEFDEIAEQLRVLGRETQAAALMKIKARRMVEALTPQERKLAQAAGMSLEEYAARRGESLALQRMTEEQRQ